MPNSLPQMRCKKVRRKSGNVDQYAIVKINGKQITLGRWGTPEARQQYERLKAEVESLGCRAVDPEYTVADLAADYLEWAEGYYQKDGKPTTSIYAARRSAKLIVELYGDTPAAEFGPRRFKTCRNKLIKRNLGVSTINDYMLKVVHAFRTAAGNELIPGTVAQDLALVSPLVAGRCKAKPSRRIPPAQRESIEKAAAHASTIIGDMMRLQLATGMRPGEVCSLRPCDLTELPEQGVTVYQPSSHKTQHHGKSRVVVLSLSAIKILKPYLSTTNATDYCFRPSEAMKECREKRKACRQTPEHQGNSEGTNRKHGRRLRRVSAKYNAGSYRVAIHRACDRAGVQRFSPNQIRKSHAVEVRRKHSLEHAQAVLGHSSLSTTERYYAAIQVLPLAIEVAKST